MHIRLNISILVASLIAGYLYGTFKDFDEGTGGVSLAVASVIWFFVFCVLYFTMWVATEAVRALFFVMC